MKAEPALLFIMEKALVIWTEDQTSYNILLGEGPNSLQLYEPWEGEEATEEKFEAIRSWFTKFKERSLLCNIKVQGEAASADEDAAAT